MDEINAPTADINPVVITIKSVRSFEEFFNKSGNTFMIMKNKAIVEMTNIPRITIKNSILAILVMALFSFSVLLIVRTISA